MLSHDDLVQLAEIFERAHFEAGQGGNASGRELAAGIMNLTASGLAQAFRAAADQIAHKVDSGSL